jgi:hypothetical protein
MLTCIRYPGPSLGTLAYMVLMLRRLAASTAHQAAVGTPYQAAAAVDLHQTAAALSTRDPRRLVTRVSPMQLVLATDVVRL